METIASITILLCFTQVINCLICDKLIPGLERISVGVDLDSLDLRHDYSVDNKDGFVHKIFEYNCTGNKKWTSPFNNITYQIPDEIDLITSLPTGMVISETQFFNTSEDIKGNMAAEAGIDVTLGKFGFGGSLSYKKAHEVLTTENKFLGENHAFVSIAHIETIPDTFLKKSLNNYFAEYVDKILPNKFENNQEAFYEFFRTYGTHYFTKANFGGLFQIQFEIDTKLREVMDYKRIKANAHASFLKILQGHGAYDKSVEKIEETFTLNAVHREMYFGGSANLFETEGYKSWWPTVANNPWLYTGNLEPIYNLFNGPKQAELAKAFKTYFYQKYLDNIELTLSNFIGKHYLGEDVAQGYLKQLKTLRNSTIQDTTILTKLNEEVNLFVVSPSWFKDETKLCANFENSYCNMVHSATPAFKPCHYQYVCIQPSPTLFSLTSNSITPPTWFSQVKIQMMQTRNEYHKHHYLRVYYKFMMTVPVNAPGWARNMKLCVFSSQPCDIAKDMQTCALPNAWTEELGFFTADHHDRDCGALSFKIITI